MLPGLIVQLPVGKPLRSTLPVDVTQVGCVIVPTVGAFGGVGSLNIAFTPVAEVQPLAVICKLLYVPDDAEMVAVPEDTTTPVKLPEVYVTVYVPFDTFVKFKTMLPFPPQVEGFVIVPVATVGVAG